MFVSLAGVLAPATGWAREGERVIEVTVRGTRTISDNTILAKVQTRPGGVYQEAIVNEDIRRLFGLGYFTDVRADVEGLPDGLRLIFVVMEKPTIERVEIEGNRQLREKKLKELFGVSPGELYRPQQVKEGSEQIRAEYTRRGFAEVDVVSHVEPHEARNTVTVYLVIDEGPRMRVLQVLVEGNEAVTDRKVRSLLKTKPKQWVFRPGVYDAQVLQEDLKRIQAFYRTQGYQNVTVHERLLEAPDGRGVYVHLRIEEGQQFRVGTIQLAGAILFPERELRDVLTLKPGQVFSEEALQTDRAHVKQYYGDRGYIHAEVTPDMQVVTEESRVNLTYAIGEGSLVSVRRVQIQGNLKTKDKVIRRELRVYPGQPFDGASIRKSITRLDNLGYFEEVNVETEPTPIADQEDLVVKVKEAKTGSLSFGGGFSSIDRLFGLVEFEQRNFDLGGLPKRFTGAGQDLRVRTEVGTVRRYFDLSFTEPWIFGHPVSFGVDAFNRTRLRSRNLGLGFEEERRGGGVRLGREFADSVRVGLSYQLFRAEISDVAGEASADLKAEEGRSNTSVVGVSVTYDKRDNLFDPTDGYLVFGSVDLAGGILAADNDFTRLEGGGSHYWPHGDRFVLESRVRAGLVTEYGDSDDVPIFERFFGGGSQTVRGYRERRIGPRDPSSNDPIGGQATMVGTVEEVLTIVEDERDRPVLQGSVFVDVGDVWRKPEEFAESFKSGVGTGFRVRTPIGPVRLDVGFPLTDVADEKRKARLHFNVSRSF